MASDAVDPVNNYETSYRAPNSGRRNRGGRPRDRTSYTTVDSSSEDIGPTPERLAKPDDVRRHKKGHWAPTKQVSSEPALSFRGHEDPLRRERAKTNRRHSPLTPAGFAAGLELQGLADRADAAMLSGGGSELDRVDGSRDPEARVHGILTRRLAWRQAKEAVERIIATDCAQRGKSGFAKTTTRDFWSILIKGETFRAVAERQGPPSHKRGGERSGWPTDRAIRTIGTYFRRVCNLIGDEWLRTADGCNDNSKIDGSDHQTLVDEEPFLTSHKA